jgi:hypothetical protein
LPSSYSPSLSSRRFSPGWAFQGTLSHQVLLRPSRTSEEQLLLPLAEVQPCRRNSPVQGRVIWQADAEAVPDLMVHFWAPALAAQPSGRVALGAGTRVTVTSRPAESSKNSLLVQ